MQHHYLPRTPALLPYIHHISFTEFETAHSEYTPVIPDCMTELVILLDGSYTRMLQDKDTQVTKSHFIGIKSKPGYVKSNPHLKTISIRFKPGAIGCFTQVPGIEYKDSLIEPEMLFGPSFSELEQKLGTSPEEDECIALLEAFFTSKQTLQEKAEKTMNRVKNVYQQPEGAQLNTLSLGHESYKTLEREFNQNIGLSPKVFLRILQFNYATYCLSQAQRTENLTEIAYRCGYFDQAHFIKSFKGFAGTTPREYGQTQDAMSKRNQHVINSCFFQRRSR